MTATATELFSLPQVRKLPSESFHKRYAKILKMESQCRRRKSCDHEALCAELDTASQTISDLRFTWSDLVESLRYENQLLRSPLFDGAWENQIAELRQCCEDRLRLADSQIDGLSLELRDITRAYRELKDVYEALQEPRTLMQALFFGRKVPKVKFLDDPGGDYSI